MPQILIFGDSIAYGAWDTEGGWAERLKIFSNKKSIASCLEFYCPVYNLAIDGDTVDGIIKKIDNETEERLLEKETIIFFATGINDSCFVKSTAKLLVSPDKFKNSIQKLIICAKKYSSKIIFIGLTPVEETKTNPIPWSTTGKSYNNINIKKYDRIIKNICLENKIYFIDILKEFEKVNYKNLLEDGLHPNTKGHEKIFEIVKNYLTKNKII